MINLKWIIMKLLARIFYNAELEYLTFNASRESVIIHAIEDTILFNTIYLCDAEKARISDFITVDEELIYIENGIRRMGYKLSLSLARNDTIKEAGEKIINFDELSKQRSKDRFKHSY